MFVLDEAAIRTLVKNAAVRSAFPFFARVAPRASSGCCGRKAPPAVTTSLHAVKLAVLALDSPQRTRLKSLLNTDTIRISYLQDGKVLTTDI